jgi:hypothetical protein
MQPITFPDDGNCVATSGNDLQAEALIKTASKSTHRTPGKGCIKYGERQEIRFKSGGTFYTNQKIAFAKPLSSGYMGPASTIFSSPALSRDETITLVFNDDNGSTWLFELSVRPACE